MKYKNYSVLMSVYYKEKPEYLKQCIDSMLNQTKKTNDFVIVEDGKLTRELEQVINDYENRYPNIFNIIRFEKNRGVGAALNDAIHYCNNEIIARMDSDDISDITRCEKELDKINEGFDIVGSNITEFENDNIKELRSKKVMPETLEQIKKYSKYRNPFNQPSVMFKKKIIMQAGNYQDLYRLEDYDLWLRCLSSDVSCYNIQESLVYMRTNNGFYKRRGGGTKNFKSYIFLRKYAFRVKQINRFEFIINIMIAFVKCYSPLWVNRIMYKTILRKK